MGLPILYILMRNDLASMNAGKGMAQASHASNAFTKNFEQYSQEMSTKQSSDVTLLKAFYDWENSTVQGFGTVIVLEGSMKDIETKISMFKKLGYISGIVHDPTYPILDGSIVHHIPLDTCGYVFVPDKDTDISAKILLCSFPLHK